MADEQSPQVTQAVQASGITRLKTPPTVVDPGPPPGLVPKKWAEPINDPPAKTGTDLALQTTTNPPTLDPMKPPARTYPLEIPRVTVPVLGKQVGTSVLPGQFSVGASVKSPKKASPAVLKAIAESDDNNDLIAIQEQKEDGETLSGMPGEERAPKEIVERFGRVEFHSTAMVAILSQGFGFQVSRLEPAQQLLLRGRITEAFTHLLNDPDTLGRVFNRIKFLCQSIWSDRKIGNIIAGMVVSAGLSAYLEDGLLDE